MRIFMYQLMVAFPTPRANMDFVVQVVNNLFFSALGFLLGVWYYREVCKLRRDK